MSTMLSFRDDELSTSFLTTDEIRKVCPMAFHTAPTNPNVSDKYVQANTATVIDDLSKMGWYPVQAKQCRGKKNSSGVRSFHLVAFQNPNVRITKTLDNGEKVVDTYPRIILTNSHDGFNSFKFMVGAIRLICSNGLVLCSQEFANISIRHINYTFEALRIVVNDIVMQIPQVVCTMNKMQKVTLNEKEKEQLALSVIKIRKELDVNDNINIDKDIISDILTPLRKEDEGNSLWRVFNVCQEKMIKGGFKSLSSNNKMRKQRKITSIKKDIDFNKKLWETALNFLPKIAV